MFKSVYTINILEHREEWREPMWRQSKSPKNKSQSGGDFVVAICIFENQVGRQKRGIKYFRGFEIKSPLVEFLNLKKLVDCLSVIVLLLTQLGQTATDFCLPPTPHTIFVIFISGARVYALVAGLVHSKCFINVCQMQSVNKTVKSRHV